MTKCKINNDEMIIKSIDEIPMFSWNTQTKEFYVLGHKFSGVNSIEDFINYIYNLDKENQQLKEQLELYDNGVIYDSRVDKLESVLDEIREYIEEKLALFPKGLVTKHLEKDYLEDLLQILDKVKE